MPYWYYQNKLDSWMYTLSSSRNTQNCVYQCCIPFTVSNISIHCVKMSRFVILLRRMQIHYILHWLWYRMTDIKTASKQLKVKTDILLLSSMLEPRRQHLLCGCRILRRQCKLVVIGLRHERILRRTNSAAASFLSLIKTDSLLC